MARSRALVTKALADGGLEQLARRTWPDGRAPSLRWIVCHMIEEYARHNAMPTCSGSRWTGSPGSSLSGA